MTRTDRVEGYFDDSGVHFTLTDPFDYMVNGNLFISVPKDFTTDFASIPRALQRVFPGG